MIENRRFRISAVAAIVSFALVFGFLFLMPETAHAKSTMSFTVSGKVSYKNANKILDKLNALRAGEGLDGLTMDKQLMKAAEQRAAEISVMYSHKRPNSKKFSSVSKYAIGENILASVDDDGNLYTYTESLSSAGNAFEIWRDSTTENTDLATPQDYANLVNPTYRTVGVCCFTRGDQRYWVCLFGTKLSSEVSKSGTASKKFNITLAKKYLTKSALSVYPTLLESGVTSKAIMFFRPKAAKAQGILPNTLFTWKSFKKSALKISKKGVFDTGDYQGKVKFTATAKAKKSCVYTGHLKIDDMWWEAEDYE